MDTRHEDPLHILVGQELSAVVFLEDYVQLRFNERFFNAYVYPLIDVGLIKLRHTDTQYAKTLHACIGEVVCAAGLIESQEIRMLFANEVGITISLRPEDHEGPEAAEFFDQTDGSITWVVY